jgi:hypothetical protein
MPATLDQVEALLKDVNDRLQAMPTPLTEEQVGQLVNQLLTAALEDPNSEFYRKMRFGRSEPSLYGTKFARWRLSPADVEFLYDLQTSLKGQRKVSDGGVYPGPSEELERTFKAISDAYYLPMEEVRKIDGQAIDNLFPRVSKANVRQWEAAMKAMDSAESGYGQQLIGAQYVADLWDAARSESRVFNLLDTFEMTAPTVYLPVEVDIPELLFVGESTTYNASNYTTVKTGSNRVSCSASKFVIHQMWSGELEEDSIIPFVPFLRRQATLALAHYSDSLVLNGDTTNAGTGNINLDDADPADTKHYLAFDGIRHAALVDNTGNAVSQAGGPVTYAALKGLQKKMVDATYLHDWGHPTDPQDLVYICDVDTADALSLLDEVITIDKFGPQASILTGQLARIGPHPLIASIAMPKTEADGKCSTTAANNIYGQVVAFNRRGLKVGWRRRVKLETERLPATDQTRLVYSLRMGLARFSPTGAASGIEWAAVLYYIGL